MNTLEKVKLEYLNTIREYSEHHKLVIYGAGINGHRLFRLLSKRNIKVDSFAVTNATLNVRDICGITVNQITWWENQPTDEYAFIIAVSGMGGVEIKAELQKHHINHIIDVPDCFEIILDDWYFSPVLEVTPYAGCVVNCRYCPQSSFLNRYYSDCSKREMTFEEFKICIDKTPDDLNIDFSGFVEPFLARETIDMILYSREKGRKIRLFTTLRGLTLEKFRKIEDVDFEMIVLHIPDKMKYANIPITEEYLELLEIFSSKKKKDGMPYVDLANCQAEPDEKVVQVINKRFPISWSLIDRAGNIDSDGNVKSANMKKTPIFCGRAAGLNHNVLLPNGDVVLCCMDYGMRHVLGNLYNNSYEDIIRSEEIRNVKYAMKHEGECLCRECTSALVQERW